MPVNVNEQTVRNIIDIVNYWQGKDCSEDGSIKTHIGPVDRFLSTHDSDTSSASLSSYNIKLMADKLPVLKEELESYSSRDRALSNKVFMLLNFIKQRELDEDIRIRRGGELSGNIRCLAKHYYGENRINVNGLSRKELDEKFSFLSTGACFSMAMSFIQAALVNDEETLYDRLAILKRDPKKVRGKDIGEQDKHFFWGKMYGSLDFAVKEAENKYKIANEEYKKEQIKEGVSADSLKSLSLEKLQETDPDTVKLLDLRAFIEQLLTYQDISKTSFVEEGFIKDNFGEGKKIKHQDAKMISKLVINDKLSGKEELIGLQATDKSVIKKFEVPYLYKMLKELRLGQGSADGLYYISGHDGIGHAIAIRITAQGYEIFDYLSTGSNLRTFAIGEEYEMAQDLKSRYFFLNPTGDSKEVYKIRRFFKPDTDSSIVDKQQKIIDSAVEAKLGDYKELARDTDTSTTTEEQLVNLLADACMIGNQVFGEHILKNIKKPFIKLEPFKENVIHVAARNGHLELVKLLSKVKGFNVKVNSTRRDGSTPLLLACEQGHTDVVRYLLKEHCADPKAARKGDDFMGKTHLSPLQAVCKHGHKEIAELILADDGFTMNDKDKNYAIDIANQNGHSEIAELIRGYKS